MRLVVVIGRHRPLLSGLGRPRDGPGNDSSAAHPTAYELIDNSRARWRA
jgi:hypothetical protein